MWAKIVKFAALVTLVLHPTSVFASAIDVQRLQGIPILSVQSYPAEAARTELRLRIMQRLKELDKWPDYESLSKNKAVAIDYGRPFVNPLVPYLYGHKYITPRVGYWGGAWEYDNLEDAKRSALRNCKGDCVLFLENDSVLLSERMVEEYIDTRQRYIADQIKLLGKADKIVLIERERSAPGVSTDTSLSLGAPRPIIVGYPDRQQDYASACFDHVFQALLPADESEKDTIAKLAHALGRGLYDPYDRAINTVLDYTTALEGRVMTKMARFAAHYRFEANPVSDKTLLLPPNLAEALAKEVVKEIWVEGSVRLTSSGLPLAIDEQVSPLAIKTDRHFYLGVQIRMPDKNGGCYVSKPFANKVLDVTSCRRSYPCAKTAVNTLLNAVRKRLQEEPFLAEDVLNEPFGPGEFGLKREFQPSRILGAPYYERSSYLIQTWSAETENPFYSSYQRQRFMGLDEERATADKVFLFMKLSHVLTRSTHKNGTYSEPQGDEIQRFDTALNAAIIDSITKACADMKSKMNGSVCELTSR